MTKDQLELLAFIRGEGHNLGKSLTVYMDGNEDQNYLAVQCLLLEREGLIQRNYVNGNQIVFVPAGASN